MPSIKILNLGPIKECEMKIENFTVLTGCQASGKSTIAKAIYFCRTVKDDILDEILKYKHSLLKSGLKTKIYLRLRNKFQQIFGAIESTDSKMEIIYYYDKHTYVVVKLK